MSASSGNLTVTAHPASSVRAGDSVIVDLDVTGPADYQAACVQTLHIWALDASGQQVWEEPVPPVMCMAIANKHVPAGAVDHFEAAWPVASTVAPGTYSIHGLFLYTLPPGAGMRVRENLPVVTVQIGG